MISIEATIVWTYTARVDVADDADNRTIRRALHDDAEYRAEHGGPNNAFITNCDQPALNEAILTNVMTSS